MKMLTPAVQTQTASNKKAKGKLSFPYIGKTDLGGVQRLGAEFENDLFFRPARKVP